MNIEDDRTSSGAGRRSQHEASRRRAWLEFDDVDGRIIKEDIDPFIEKRVDELMSMMYEHFLSFEETRSYFPDQTNLARAREAQRQYFLRLHFDSGQTRLFGLDGWSRPVDILGASE
jgi:hypothetical protein